MIKKICLISQDFYPMKGGIASYLLEVYYKYLKSTNFEVIVPDYIGTKEKFNLLPFKVHQISFAPFNLDDSERIKCNQRILKVLNKIKPDVILFGYLRSHTEIGLLYKKENPKTIIGLFAHAKEMFIDNCIVQETNKNGSHKGYSKKEADFYKKIMNSMDVILSVSNFTKTLLKSQGISSNIIILNPPIKDMKLFDKLYARELIGIDKECPVLLSVGRFIKRKGQSKIVKLIPELKKKFPNIRYILVGDGPEMDVILKDIEEFHLQNEVLIFSSVKDEDLGKFYSACDVFILPCDFIQPNDVEGLGIVFLEANSLGRPCIGGNSGGVPEAVLNHKTGLLVDPKSNKDILHKISLLLGDKELRDTFGKNGIERVSFEFNNIESNFLIDFFNNLRESNFHS